MSAVVALNAVRSRRETQARAEAAAHQARLAEALRDAAECCETALAERDVETARDALAALICDASAPETMPHNVLAWRKAKVLRLTLRLMQAEEDLHDLAARGASVDATKETP
ncbi:hypothetical protein [Methylocystis parvus]|uniref:hypothetical protein n=1 Tax=Methylocystis parvus TaxID=134 RepID=UPI003C75D200